METTKITPATNIQLSKHNEALLERKEILLKELQELEVKKEMEEAKQPILIEEYKTALKMFENARIILNQETEEDAKRDVELENKTKELAEREQTVLLAESEYQKDVAKYQQDQKNLLQANTEVARERIKLGDEEKEIKERERLVEAKEFEIKRNELINNEIKAQSQIELEEAKELKKKYADKFNDLNARESKVIEDEINCVERIKNVESKEKQTIAIENNLKEDRKSFEEDKKNLQIKIDEVDRKEKEIEAREKTINDSRVELRYQAKELGLSRKLKLLEEE